MEEGWKHCSGPTVQQNGMMDKMFAACRHSVVDHQWPSVCEMPSLDACPSSGRKGHTP